MRSLVLALLISTAAPAMAQQTQSRSFFDDRGPVPTGSSKTHGNSTIYDARGPGGFAIRNGNTISVYDRSGRYVGSSVVAPRRR
jgi:hypothetical protein